MQNTIASLKTGQKISIQFNHGFVRTYTFVEYTADDKIRAYWIQKGRNGSSTAISESLPLANIALIAPLP